MMSFVICDCDLLTGTSFGVLGLGDVTGYISNVVRGVDFRIRIVLIVTCVNVLQNGRQECLMRMPLHVLALEDVSNGDDVRKLWGLNNTSGGTVKDRLERKIQDVMDVIVALREDLRKSDEVLDKQHREVMDFLRGLRGSTSQSDRDGPLSHDRDFTRKDRHWRGSPDEGQTQPLDLRRRVQDLKRRVLRLELQDESSRRKSLVAQIQQYWRRHLPRVYQSFSCIWRSNMWILLFIPRTTQRTRPVHGDRVPLPLWSTLRTSPGDPHSSPLRSIRAHRSPQFNLIVPHPSVTPPVHPVTVAPYPPQWGRIMPRDVVGKARKNWYVLKYIWSPEDLMTVRGSLPSRNRPCHEVDLVGFHDARPRGEAKYDKWNRPFGVSMVSTTHVPQQTKGGNCGAHTLRLMEYVLENRHSFD
ncbi:hypothetical protein Dsin_001104 [Dipteronia sinensis]|uniref:Uncharacterized protein n=1 Tax=Dipteronia sinensis TaxID=43782 RepID=A0AAE0EI24_9ROSI|nr:hypothetical protein Dsin_001104 [Dipteronia sinensis]